MKLIFSVIYLIEIISVIYDMKTIDIDQWFSHSDAPGSAGNKRTCWLAMRPWWQGLREADGNSSSEKSSFCLAQGSHLSARMWVPSCPVFSFFFFFFKTGRCTKLCVKFPNFKQCVWAKPTTSVDHIWLEDCQFATLTYLPFILNFTWPGK